MRNQGRLEYRRGDGRAGVTTLFCLRRLFGLKNRLISGKQLLIEAADIYTL